MNRGVREIDTDEVDRAVALLRDAGFAVDEITELRPDRDGHGVRFDLSLFAPSRSKLDLKGDEDRESVPGVIVALDPSADAASFAEEIRTRPDVQEAAEYRVGVTVEEVEGGEI